MTIKNFTDLNTGLADNTTGLILPTNVRDIVDSFAMYRILGATNTNITATTTPTVIPMTAIGTPTTGTSMVALSGVIVFAQPGRYLIDYKLLAQYSAAKDVTIALYDQTGTKATYSDVVFTTVNGKTTTMIGNYIVRTFAANDSIEVRVSCDSTTVNLTNVQSFMSAISLPVIRVP